MSVPANIAARKSAEAVIDLINGELRTLIDQHGQDSLIPFFATLRECYGENLTIRIETRPPGPKPMNAAEARAFGQRRMPWGKHKGKLISETPVDYLQWVLDQPDTFKVEIERYLISEWVRKAEGEKPEVVEEELPF